MKKISYFLTLFLCATVLSWAEAPVIETAPKKEPQPETTATNEVKPTEPPASQSASTNQSTEAPAETEDEETPYPQSHATSEKSDTPSKPSAPPSKYGDASGKAWIGQRVVAERYAGWGWIKEDGQNWRNSKWIMLEEQPGKINAPQRFYSNREASHNMQFRLYGEFASYKGYEPNADALVPVFVLKGFETIGQGEPINLPMPGPSGARKGRISERGVNSAARFGR
ncbi:MAG: hypothetical protein V1746_06790 [bacterium]